MAITNKGSKWETKNSLYIITALIPVINFFPFFYMKSRVSNKKWSILSWVALLINIALVIGLIVSMVVDNPNDRPYYYEVVESPKAIDYMTNEQKKQYYEDYSYEYSTEFKITEQYEEYEKDYKQWQKDSEEWEKTPEITAQIEKYNSFNQTQRGLSAAFYAGLSVAYILFLIIAFTERPKYLRMLANQDNRMILQDRMAGNSYQPGSYSNSNRVPVASQQIENRAQNIQQNVQSQPNQYVQTPPQPQVVDINTATEEQLAVLQGLNIIDAKKAVQYREANGGFKSVDEFFGVINAKPHIIARLENQLTVSVYQSGTVQKPEHGSKRTLDL